MKPPKLNVRSARYLPELRSIFLIAESPDDTVARAEVYGASVEIRPWTNFCEARAYALQQVQTPWLFMLDADEELSPQLQAALLEVTTDEQIAGYQCERQNRFCGRIIRGGAWAHERVLRCVRTARASIQGRNGGSLHEHLVADGRVAELAGVVEHYSYPTLQSYWQKFSRYTTLEAREYKHATWPDLLKVTARELARAGWHITARRGWRDGWRGWFIAFASALYGITVVQKALRGSK